jgi:hypothetical protein
LSQSVDSDAFPHCLHRMWRNSVRGPSREQRGGRAGAPCGRNAPPCGAARQEGGNYARRPVSRVLSPLRGAMDGHSSGTSVTGRLSRPTRAATRKRVSLPRKEAVPPLFGLAPGGVCRAAPVAGRAVRSYRTLSPLPADPRTRGRFAFCGTFPRVAPAGRYPAPCFRGARTFLPAVARRAAVRPSGVGGNLGPGTTASSALWQAWTAKVKVKRTRRLYCPSSMPVSGGDPMSLCFVRPFRPVRPFLPWTVRHPGNGTGCERRAAAPAPGKPISAC